MKEKVTFLGYFCDSKKHHDKVLSNADNSFQYGYIKSLSNNYELKLVSTNNFSNKKENYIDDNIIYIGGLSKLKKFINLYKVLKDDKLIVYYNNLFLYNFVCYFLKLFKKTKYIVIMITDPYDIKNTNIISKIINKIRRKFSNKIINKADGIITITSEMNVKHHNRIVINGGIDKELLDKYKNKKVTKENCLMYTGNLYYRYNLNLIIAAVNDLKINLKIYGDGEQKEEIISKQNSIVKYCGNLEKESLIEYQKKATALIALLNNDELSKKTFPSKIFEYIASGSEVIVSDLDILDNDLKDLCHVVKEINKESIKNVLIDVFNKNIRKNNELKAYKVLNDKYTWDSYSEKLKKIIDGVIYEKNI